MVLLFRSPNVLTRSSPSRVNKFCFATATRPSLQQQQQPHPSFTSAPPPPGLPMTSWPANPSIQPTLQQQQSAWMKASSIPPRQHPLSDSKDASASASSQLAVRPPLTMHHFDTHAFVQNLQSVFTKSQAQLIMEIMQQQLRRRLAHTKEQLLSSAQLENEAHILRAGMNDLRNAVMIYRRNDAAILRAELNSLAKEIDQLEEQLNEDLTYLRNSIDLTMNDFRAEGRQEQNLALIETQQVNHHITVLFAEAKMEVERLKWQTIWQSLLSILATGLGLTAAGFGLAQLRARKPAVPILTHMDLDDSLTVADMEIIG
ncbi:hypothetical protein BC940DRAFT_298534 [Gongronella butleri]|nr:hypothetical protein BC940DRAFT_298534 [Gongronella butleri]